MNINKLEELAKAATPGPWLCDWPMDEIEDENEPADVSVWQGELFSGKFINNICLDNAIIDGNYIAAANPSAVLELIAAYRESVAAIKYVDSKWPLQMAPVEKALATARRLGVE